MIDVPVEAGDDGVVATASAKTSRIDSRCGLMIVGPAGAFIVPFAGVMIEGSVGGMFGVDVDMLAELCMVAAAIDLAVFVTVSRVGDTCDGV